MQRGFSLVELMVAMVLGLMLVAVIGSIFLSSNRNYKEDNRFARMQENGRFAVNALITDIGMAGMWGTLSNTTDIISTVSTSGDCGMNFAATTTPNIVAANPVVIVNNPSNGSAVSSVFNCITSSTVWTGGTTHADVIAIKRVMGGDTAASSSSTNNVYLQIDVNAGTLVTTSPSSFVSGNSYWQYYPRIYYIRNYAVTAGDGIPTLCREELSGTSMSTVPLVEGIENMQIEFGIDTDADGTPNYYDPNPDPTVDPTIMSKVINAKFYVLARSLDQDPLYTNDKTYNLGSVTIDLSGAPDNYYRRVYEGTISLRNVSGYSLLGGL